VKRREFLGVAIGAFAAKKVAAKPAPLGFAFHKDALALRIVTRYEARYDTAAERFVTCLDVMATWPLVIYG
jgi:hypothetical protein